jgi:hypothetical protein
MTTKTDLLDALDVAATHLLEKAGVGGKVDGEKPSLELPLTDQVKAFEAVVDWVKIRKDLRPPQKEESRFDGIKREFNSATASNRRSKPKKKANGTAIDFGSDTDSDANPSDGASTALNS